MFHLLLVLLRRADYYWLYDGSVCVQSQVGGREWLVGVTTGQCSVPGSKAVISAAQPTYVLAWVTQLGPSLPLMYGGCRHLLTAYTGTL